MVMKTALTLLITDLMYRKQLNNDDLSYMAAIDETIEQIEKIYLQKERQQIEQAYEQGCRIYRNFDSFDIKGKFYFDTNFE